MSRKFVAALAVLGLLTAGCELRADLRLELNADESGAVLVTLGLDEEFQALVESSEEPVDEALFGADNPFGELPGAETRVYEDDGFTFYEGKVPFSDLNGLRLLGTDADNFLNEFDIDIDDETARVSGSFDLTELTGGDLADDQLAGVETDALAEIFKFHIQIKLPGTVTEHNADRVLGDGSLEWDIPLTGVEDTLEISGVSSLAGGGGSSTLLIVVLLLAVVAAAAFFFLRSRRSAPATAAVAAPTPAAAPPEEAPPVTEIEPPETEQ